MSDAMLEMMIESGVVAGFDLARVGEDGTSVLLRGANGSVIAFAGGERHPEPLVSALNWANGWNRHRLTTRERKRERRDLRALAKAVWPLDTDTAQLLLKRARNG